MTKEDAIAKVNTMLNKVLAYGPSRKNEDQKKSTSARKTKGSKARRKSA
jgi:hypothetical protein